MTIDERLEFLLQSTKSLHARVQEQSAQIAQQFAQIPIQTEQRLIDADNIRRLARIAEARLNRISDLNKGEG